MNYLTNYYKNLCEQLQERIDILEARIRSPKEIENIGLEAYMKAGDELKAQKKAQGGSGILSSAEIDDLLQKHYNPYLKRAIKREDLIRTAGAQVGSAALSGDVETVQQYGDVVSDMTRMSSLKQASPEETTPGFAKEMKGFRDRGTDVNVPADIAAMRKVVSMGKRQYTAPFPTPETMHVTPSHY